MSLTPLQLVNVDPLFIGIVAVYFAVVLGIGYYGYKTTKTEEDFLVAGRNVGPLVGGATLDRKSTRLNSSHRTVSRMPSSA